MVDIFHCGPAALISAIFDELKIGQAKDMMVHWNQDQCRMSSGTRVKASIINIFGRRAY